MKLHATKDEVNTLARDLNENPSDWRVVTDSDQVHALWQAQACLVLDTWEAPAHRPGVFLANRKRGQCLLLEINPEGYPGGSILLHNILFRMHKPVWELIPYRILWSTPQFHRKSVLVKAAGVVLTEDAKSYAEPFLENTTELRALPECSLNFNLE